MRRCPVSGLRHRHLRTTQNLLRRSITLSIRTKRRSTRSFAAVIAAALIASVLALVAVPVAAKTPIQGTTSTSADGRITGADRYETATKAASSYLVRRGTLTSWNTIIAVSGDNYPDALSAASLAGALTAPIILMPSDGTLPLVVKEWALTKRDQVQSNSTTTAAFKIHAVGGTSALPDAGLKLLMAEFNKGDADGGLVTMTRTSGATRAATAAAVANTKNAAGANIILSGTKEIFIANEASFADAMSIAPYLFNAAAPIVLTPAGSLGADAKAVLKTYKTLTGTEITIIGGKSAVSDQVITDLVTAGHKLSSIERISGADRYATSVAVTKWMNSSVADNNANFSFNSVVLVNGENFPDGLAAAPYAGFGTGSAARMVMLTTAANIAPAVATQMTTLAKTMLPTNLYVVGGTSAVSAAAVSGSMTASAGQDTTSTLTCVESTGGTGVTLKIPGNITGGTVGTTTSLGNEQVLILNGSLTINGSSNAASPTVAMVSSSYSAVTGMTTLTGLVTAGVLAKGTVITWNGLTELANTVVRRKITGATCTIADDKTGIGTVTIQANVGASSIDVTFAEKVVGFDCGDVVATIAAIPTGVPVGCTLTGPNTAGTTYRLDYFADYNGDNFANPAWSQTASSATSGVITIGTDTTVRVGDPVTVASPAGTGCVASMFIRENASSTTIGLGATWGGHGGVALAALIACTTATGTISSAAETGNIAIAAADSFVFDGRVKFAPVVVSSTAAISTISIPGCTVTTAAVHGLVAGDIVTIAGLTTSADDGTYEVDTLTSTTVFTIRHPAVAGCNGTSGAAATTSEAGGVVYDVSNNAGTVATTKTVNAVTDADVTKPVLSASFLCSQTRQAVISNGTSITATAASAVAGGPQGVAGNAYKLSIVNARGQMTPKVVVDDTAKTVTITGDLAYASSEDVAASAANDGVTSWAITRQTGSAGDAIGTASATVTALKSNGGGTGDVTGTQTCTISITSNERLQSSLLTANTVTGAVAINGVATTLSSSGAFAVINANQTKFTSSGTIAPLSTVVAGTVTVTLTDSGALLKDMKGNQVTVLAVQG